MELLFVLRPVLVLALFVLLAWLVARILRRSLLGRVGEFGKLAFFAAVVGFYALVVVLTAIGGPSLLPGFLMPLAMPKSQAVLLIAAGLLLVVWLVLREMPFPMPHQFGFLLDSPVRRLLLPAEATLYRLPVGPGMRVLEVGCGTGYLTAAVAQRLKPGGVLFSVDIQPQMVERTQRRVEKSGADNVTVLLAPADKLPFEVYDVDVVFMVHVLGEIPGRLAALREAYRVMKPSGVLMITEGLLDPHYRRRSDVVRLCRHAGFGPAGIEGSLFLYSATFRKPQPKEPLGYVPRPG